MARMIPAAQQATPPLLFRMLGIGLTLMVAGAAVAAALGYAPLLEERDAASRTIGLVAAAGWIAASLVALLMLKPRVPERRPGQTVDQYWSTPATAAAAIRVWFVLEGACLLAAMGFLMTGEPLAAIAMGLGLPLFWGIGPNTFAKQRLHSCRSGAHATPVKSPGRRSLWPTSP
jgi:hypothetical protein